MFILLLSVRGKNSKKTQKSFFYILFQYFTCKDMKLHKFISDNSYCHAKKQQQPNKPNTLLNNRMMSEVTPS